MSRTGGGSAPRRPRTRARRHLVVAGILLFAGLLAARLVQLQVLDAEKMQGRASRQHRESIELTPRRGEIHDREGRLLALSVSGASVGLRPQAIPEERREEIVQAVARLTGREASWLSRRIEASSGFFFAVRQGSAQLGEALRRMDLPGVDVLEEWRREYPHRSLAAGLLGGVNLDGFGAEGLEYLHNGRLSGPKRREMFLLDGLHVPFRAEGSEAVVPPSLELTLDSRLQAAAEELLAEGVREAGARKGVAVAMDPRTGEVLAMASYPGFDLMARGGRRKGRVPLGAVETAFEPGSVMKALTVAAALDAGVLREGDGINLGDGRLELPGKDLEDHDRKLRGWITLSRLMALSSNVGAALVARRLEPEVFRESLRRFGVGRETGVDLPTENCGILRPPSAWTGRSQAMIAIGQEVSVTPLGLLTSFSAIANEGVRPVPRLARAWIDREGGRHPEPLPAGERVMTAETARITSSLLEAVVEKGTGRAAAVPGYRAAGKTGTAQKPIPGQGYPEGFYVSTFVGFAPLPRPEVALVVVIDEPRNGYYAAEVAAPVWSKIMAEALRMRRVPPEGALVTLERPLLARTGEKASERKRATPKEPA